MIQHFHCWIAISLKLEYFFIAPVFPDVALASGSGRRETNTLEGQSIASLAHHSLPKAMTLRSQAWQTPPGALTFGPRWEASDSLALRHE